MMWGLSKQLDFKSFKNEVKHFIVEIKNYDGLDLKTIGTGILISSELLNNNESLFLLTSKRLVWNEEINSFYENIKIGVSLIDKESKEILDEPYYFSINSKSQIWQFNGDLAAIDLTKTIELENEKLISNNQLLFMLGFDLCKFYLDQLELFDEVLTCGFVNQKLTTVFDDLFLAKFGIVGSNPKNKNNSQKYFYVDNQLINFSLGSFVFKLDDEEQVFLVGMVVGRLQSEYSLNEKLVSTDLCYQQVISSSKILNFLLQRLKTN